MTRTHPQKFEWWRLLVSEVKDGGDALRVNFLHIAPVSEEVRRAGGPTYGRSHGCMSEGEVAPTYVMASTADKHADNSAKRTYWQCRKRVHGNASSWSIEHGFPFAPTIKNYYVEAPNKDLLMQIAGQVDTKPLPGQEPGATELGRVALWDTSTLVGHRSYAVDYVRSTRTAFVVGHGDGKRATCGADKKCARGLPGDGQSGGSGAGGGPPPCTKDADCLKASGFVELSTDGGASWTRYNDFGVAFADVSMRVYTRQNGLGNGCVCASGGVGGHGGEGRVGL